MPKLSKETAPNAADLGPMSTRSGELAGYTVEFTTFHEDADGAPVFRGLPDDRCQSPHWGYVLSGAVTFRYADRDETYAAGYAYYAEPGHVPVVTTGTEVVEFSPPRNTAGRSRWSARTSLRSPGPERPAGGRVDRPPAPA
jgi:hypothetical protein